MSFVSKLIFRRSHEKWAQGRLRRKHGLLDGHNDYFKMRRHKKCARGKIGHPDGYEGYVKMMRHTKCARGRLGRKLGPDGHEGYVKMITPKKCAQGRLGRKLGPDGHEGYVKMITPKKCAQGRLGRKLGPDGHEGYVKMITPKKCAQGVLTRNLGLLGRFNDYTEMMRTYHENIQKHEDLYMELVDLTVELEKLRFKIDDAQREVGSVSKIKELRETSGEMFERHKKVAAHVEEFTFARLL